MKKLLLCLAVGVAFVSHAQQFEVVELQQVKTGAHAVYHPRFMPDGKTLLVSAENYDGLGLINIEKGTYTNLTTMPGAGWCAEISEDGKTILTRGMDRENLTQSIYALDVATKGLTVVAENIEHVNDIALVNGVATVAIKGKAVSKAVADAITPVRTMNNVFLTNEDLKMVLYKNGERIVLDPLAGQFGDWDPQYCWASLSPDKTKILFHCANYTYTCDLNGNNVVNLGEMGAAQWRGNNHIVGHNEDHDGYFLTKGEIMIVRADGTQMQQLTSTTGEIKLFPAVSADGNKIAFHTEKEGKIYIMTIKEK